MTPRLFVQLEVAALAVFLPGVAVFGWLRSRRGSYLVLMAQILLVPEIGIVAYALDPNPSVTPWIYVSAAILVVGVLFMLWTISSRRRLLAGPITFAQLEHLNGRAVVSRVLMVAFFTSLLLNSEPWFGVANLALNAVLAFALAAPRWRVYALKSDTPIQAPPSTVFDYLVDTALWPQYRVGGQQLLSVDPPGRLAVGSRIVTRQAVPTGRATTQLVVDTTSAVTQLVPDRALETVWLERPSEHTRIELDVMPDALRVHVQVMGRLPFRDALAGLVFDVRSVLKVRQAEFERNFTRLKHILEAVPAK